MDKKYIVIVGALIMILVLVLEPLSRGGLFGSSSAGVVLKPGENVTGTTVFNGTLRTYDPILYMDPIPDQSLVNELRNLPGVLDVKSETNALVVQTETRDDVFPTAAWLNERNITCYAVANIAAGGQIAVQTATGTVNATIYGGVVRVITEPLVDSGEQVAVSMVAVVSSDQVIDYSSASLLLQPEELTLDAEVESLDGVTATYTIPWEERNSLDLSGLEDTEYDKVDSIIFTTPLTVSQVLAKKQFTYITYIDANSAQVESSFDNTTLLETNLQDTPFTLPDSTLVVRAEEEPDLSYSPDSVSYRYTLRLQDVPYQIDDTMVLETEKEYGVGDTVQVTIEVLVLGDKALSVRYVSLPS